MDNGAKASNTRFKCHLGWQNLTYPKPLSLKNWPNMNQTEHNYIQNINSKNSTQPEKSKTRKNQAGLNRIKSQLNLPISKT
jgi:hypothetical protein